ncbi:DegT/DnrJ/EryC1/StrS family aminotransferase [Marinobacterium nitratireducens]|uniref:DegT/DnrJ/EryC1/StrS family aminotransferase n=1 Tax=Marinobacterium nitratireducens TaxID=518897 RepID=UPI00166B29CC|nr:DegT/DnrJ/EryC1/StrS aminotransferase family protein [Marinobacterium nitratireducens]
MLNTAFSPWPSYSEEEAETASRVLLSNKVNYWTGVEGKAFEAEFAKTNGCTHAIAVSNGTVALELALRALGLGPGDEVVVTCRTFIASASAIVSVGALPVFADIDWDSQNITAKTVEAVLSSRTRAIICVHLAGWPCDMDPLLELASQHDLVVIEDCAQAHGARYKGRSVGTLGDVGAWSFCQDKIMTTGGEGGMITTSNEALWKKIWALKDHGKSWDTVHATEHPPGFRWLHESFGTNARMTEMQAAIGRLQLQRLESWNAARSRNANAILEVAKGLPGLRVTEPPDYVRHAWYKCYVFVEPDKLKAQWTRDRIVTEINERGVPCYTGSCSEVYREKAFDGTGWRPERPLPVARELGETSLMFLVHPTLTADEIDKTCRVLEEVMEEAAAE